jgi:aspartyl/asparaginyl-tRNA synthetase
METTAQPTVAAVFAETPAATIRAWSARHPLPVAQRQRVHDVVLERVHSFLVQEGYEEVAALEASAAAGPGDEAASIFSPDFLEDADLGHPIRQLHLERIVAGGRRRVYCASDSQRRTGRADARPALGSERFEAVQRDMCLVELCDFQEHWLQHVAAGLHADLIGGPNATRIDRMLRGGHPRLTYREALDVLNRRGFALAFGEQLDPLAHAALVRHCGNLPLQITHYPADITFFCARLDRRDSAVAERVDYILPSAGNALSGSVHESDAVILSQRLRSDPFHARLLVRAQELARRRGFEQPDSDREEIRGAFARMYEGAIERACTAYLEPYARAPIERAGCGLKTGRLLQYLLGLDSLPAVMA